MKSTEMSGLALAGIRGRCIAGSRGQSSDRTVAGRVQSDSSTVASQLSPPRPHVPIEYDGRYSAVARDR